jgi:hypothetical protein
MGNGVNLGETTWSNGAMEQPGNNLWSKQRQWNNKNNGTWSNRTIEGNRAIEQAQQQQNRQQ